jgi:GNAT superfamily N-acetyltransferase
VIREATEADKALVDALWQAFEAEVPDVPWRADEAEGDLARDLVLLADDVGVAAIEKHERRWFVDLLYVRPDARGRGIGRALMREVTERAAAAGIDALELEVLESNSDARRLYDRLGFRTVARTLAVPVAAPAGGATYGAVHVQNDDADLVRRNATKALHAEPEVALGNGWTRVDAPTEQLRNLARELSFTTGVSLALSVESGAVVRYVLFDRGSMVDEYASVPEYFGALPPGDVIALGANPTVVARLTGADPARVRAVARTATSPDELPPADELYRQIADVLGVEVE